MASELKGNEETMKKGTGWERWHLLLLMLLVFLIGIILILASYVLVQKGIGDWSLLHDIGIAFMIAGILGVTVDQVIRWQLAEDAFKASIGYILPDELKGEMEWIYRSHILCTEYMQICELKPIDDDTCELHIEFQKTLKNISKTKEKVHLGISIDEWFHSNGSSEILSFGYAKGKERQDKFPKMKGDYGALSTSTEIMLASGETVRTWAKIKEIKRTNDISCWALEHPAIQPKVTVRAYNGVRITPSFGYRVSGEQTAPDTFILPGTLLPGQRIEIRWAKITDIEKWNY